jgi:DNA repair exonuclease SbcCD nuclease subunit
MFKFIHAADLHLDSPMQKLDLYEGAPVSEFRAATRRALENLVQLAISEGVAFVLIAGDLFDGDWKDYNTGLYLVSQLNRLRDAGIPVFILAGNHDAASNITRTLRFPETVRVFPSNRPATFQLPSPAVAVHGQSFATPAVREDLSARYPAPLAGLFNIGMLHTSAGGREGHAPYAPCSVTDLRDKGYDYWALGHVHQHEVLCEDPPIVFPGNTQGRHARETGAKGCVLVSVPDDGTPRLAVIPLDVVRWVTAVVDVSTATDGYEVVHRTREHLEKLLMDHDGKPLAVRVRLTGETAAHGELFSDLERWTGEIRSMANDAGGGRIWVEKLRIETRMSVTIDEMTQRDGAMGELLSLFEELSAERPLQADLVSELDDLVKRLPPELRSGPEGIPFSDEAWMQEMLMQVRPFLIRRLLRKGPADAD